jgi:hypothetical protein
LHGAEAEGERQAFDVLPRCLEDDENTLHGAP